MFHDFGVEAESVSVKAGEKTFTIKRGGQYGLYKVSLDRCKGSQPIDGYFTSTGYAQVAINNYTNNNNVASVKA